MRLLLLALLLHFRGVGALRPLGIPAWTFSVLPMSSTTKAGSDSDRGAASSPPPLVLVDPLPPSPDLTYSAWADHTKRTLQSLYYGISAPFCCGGTVSVPEPVRVTVRATNQTYTIQPPPVPGGTRSVPDVDVDAAKERVRLQVEQLRKFVEQAPPAVFGRGFEEQFDVSVRNGRQLAAADFAPNIDPTVLQNVLRTVQVELGLQVGIEAEPYSINIYEEGGLFESHKDTPRGRAMFGTLVLCLPSLFVGGALQVGMNLQTTRSFFGRHLDQCEVPFRDNLSGDPSWWRRPDEASKESEGGGVSIPWCAFFSDSDHRVLPVWKGVRVTLSYLLRRSVGVDTVASDDDNAAAPRALEDDENQDRALVETFLSIKANPFKRDVRIGFPCDHLYTTSEVFPDQSDYDDDESDDEESDGDGISMLVRNQIDPAIVEKLKGRDAMVARAATKAGFRVYLMPFINSRNPMGPDSEDEGDYYTRKFGFDDYEYVDEERPVEYFFHPPAEGLRPHHVANIWVKGHRDGRRERIGAVG
jgi:hypothetical protein